MKLIPIEKIVRCPKVPPRINVIKTYCRVCQDFGSSDGRTVLCNYEEVK